MPFKAIQIKNFQSHKDTELDLESGVNVLTGSSDQGKSAILRAILWVVNNRPLGIDDIVSHWARDEKGKINDVMKVTVYTDDGVVTRKRTINDNEYILNYGSLITKAEIFKAINKDVPEDIQQFLKLSDVNIQQQHDAPFLLSASAADVAKYFNKIVRLDVIDTVLGNAESMRRDTNKKIKEYETVIKSLENKLDEFDWIESAQGLAEKVEKVNEKIIDLNRAWQVIDCEVKDYLIQKDYLKKFPDIKKVNELIEKIENITIDYEEVNELEKDIEKYREINRARKIFEMVKSGKELLNEIENIKPGYDAVQLIQSEIQEYENAKKTKDQMDSEVINLKLELPDVCPECGQPIMECVA